MLLTKIIWLKKTCIILSSVDETRALSKLQIAYSGIETDILKSRTPGFIRMLTMSNRFVIPVQTELYNPKKED